tara:strand:+ start:7395 stop:7880 length:486 start_codon:yes stop_codon:yes gene_type:complete
MRFSAPVMAFFFAFKNTIRISPLTTFNNDIYHYNPTFDIYRYGSKDRKLFKKRYKHLVQDHHVIPKQLKDHELIKTISYDINSANNLVIMPTMQGISKLNLDPSLQCHYKGHTKYNAYVKHTLTTIYKSYHTLDEKKYIFWLFYKYLKENCKYITSDIPWI